MLLAGLGMPGIRGNSVLRIGYVVLSLLILDVGQVCFCRILSQPREFWKRFFLPKFTARVMVALCRSGKIDGLPTSFLPASVFRHPPLWLDLSILFLSGIP